MSSIHVAKGLMQYAGIAPETKQCQGCLHGSASSQTYPGRYYCAKGGFFVASVAGCKEWRAKALEASQ
jgi:recombinational DNA repair protein (RecF pathway)